MATAWAAESGSSHTTKVASGITITRVSADVKEAIQQRDDSMDFKCKGGMFDCGELAAPR